MEQQHERPSVARIFRECASKIDRGIQRNWDMLSGGRNPLTSADILGGDWVQKLGLLIETDDIVATERPLHAADLFWFTQRSYTTFRAYRKYMRAFEPTVKALVLSISDLQLPIVGGWDIHSYTTARITILAQLQQSPDGYVGFRIEQFNPAEYDKDDIWDSLPYPVRVAGASLIFARRGCGKGQRTVNRILNTLDCYVM